MTKQDNLAKKALKNLRIRLLDLTTRNRLINFRHSKRRSLRIIDELPDQLFETLLEDNEMKFLPVREPTRQQLLSNGYIEIHENTKDEIILKKYPSAAEWANILGLSTSFEVPEPSGNERAEKHSDKAIQTLYYPHELEGVLKGLRQLAESAIQETGTNILYLSFGFLEWNDTYKGDKKRLAPLFLMPVRLHKGRLDSKNQIYRYTVSYSGEDIIPNLSLREKLQVDFGMVLPGLDENTMPEDYFFKVQEVIKAQQPDWRIHRFVTLTLLRFSKLLMYLDLNPELWPTNNSIVDNSIVRQLLIGQENGPDSKNIGSNNSLGFGEEYRIDEINEIHTKYPLVFDADSSQHSCLIDVLDGKNLVIEGPPGTGKSQTISNIIAAAIAQGKRVLFVAEKLAALEVVRHKLNTVQLGEFCLELHSYKSRKRRVLDEIQYRIEKHGKYRKPKDIATDIARYEELKKQLNDYVEQINLVWKSTGKTLHEIFMAATRYREAIEINPTDFHPFGHTGDNTDPIAQRRMEDQVDAFQMVYLAVTEELDEGGALRDHPWFGVGNRNLQIFDIDKIRVAIENWQVSLHGLVSEREILAKGLKCELKRIPTTISGISSLSEDLKCLSSVLEGNEVLESIPLLKGKVLESGIQNLERFQTIQSLFEELQKAVEQRELQDLLNVDAMQDAYNRFGKLVHKNITIRMLYESIKSLTAIHGKLTELEDPLLKIRSTVSEQAQEFLLPTEKGLFEFKFFIDLVISLNPSYWKFRNEIFENEELDILLPILRKELKQLKLLWRQLDGIFVLNSLPGETEIRILGKVLEGNRFFSLLKRDWWKARKQIRNLAASRKIKLSALILSLDRAAEFAKRRAKFESNGDYRIALGSYMKGLDTDIDALESTRKWYKAVRLRYGYGFGSKVPLGDAIIKFPEKLLRGLRSLGERGVLRELDSVLDGLQDAKRVFTNVPKLKKKTTLLVGENGLLSSILNSVDEGINTCKPLLADENISFSQLENRIEKLVALKNEIKSWEEANIDNELFKGKLGLKIGPEADNKIALQRFQNTISLATVVNRQIKSKSVLHLILNAPTVSTFNDLSDLAQHLNVAIKEQQTAYNSFNDLVHLTSSDWFKPSKDRIDMLIERNKLAIDNDAQLAKWLDYIRVRDKVLGMGFDGLVSAIEKGAVEVQKIGDACRAGIFDLLAREILQEKPTLETFLGRSQESIREKFRMYDNRLKELQCENIIWKSDQVEIPAGNSYGKVGEYTENCLLKHECGKKKRHLPVRQLLKRAGNAMQALKPCFMMSPMSVAQYLEPSLNQFDLVVMDEASQIKPEDALGAIARGTQLVVVGDPKQLPPTTFFERTIEEEDDDGQTAIEELESILDATLPMFPERRLRWHYRSQHESLVSFSNHFFYNGDLVLFPSPYKKTDKYGIHYSRVDLGSFVNRRNIHEAQSILEAVQRHFKYHPNESLGIVAMNSEQRLQIENVIESMAKECVDFRVYLEKDAKKKEPLFIKNLENVQGDERDAIFISMTYGPQEPGGRVFQRFGPINSNVGWRRLNVLFTRSRKRMHVFSSMGSQDIIADAKSSRGVQALRNFLSFCETGVLKTEKITGRLPDSDFEIAVMTALEKKGFTCTPQVGVSGFFIDIAVVDPGNPGRFLMGIECDGATYHSAKSARDRDRLRQEIIESRGWLIRRIWSTDWFKSPHSELQPILRELNELKTEPTETEPKVAELEDQETASKKYVFSRAGIEAKLKNFNMEVIKRQLQNTEEYQRLLRPAMIEAFMEYLPRNKAEFLELVPSYLRKTIDGSEYKYLEDVLRIIASVEMNVT